jgi:uracil-DNA glycosylase
VIRPAFTHEVRALFPARGPVNAIIYGEAPGPRGADQSGIPFWGDRSGRPLYRALVAAGMATVVADAWDNWDGAELTRLRLRPTLSRVALSNAFPRCPTRDHKRFCAPSRSQLSHPENLARITSEIDRAARRCDHQLLVIALGRVAEHVLAKVATPRITLHGVPHPSAQALLSTAPNHGKGMSLATLAARWESNLVRLLKMGTVFRS